MWGAGGDGGHLHELVDQQGDELGIRVDGGRALVGEALGVGGLLLRRSRNQRA